MINADYQPTPKKESAKEEPVKTSGATKKQKSAKDAKVKVILKN